MRIAEKPSSPAPLFVSSSAGCRWTRHYPQRWRKPAYRSANTNGASFSETLQRLLQDAGRTSPDSWKQPFEEVGKEESRRPGSAADG